MGSGLEAVANGVENVGVEYVAQRATRGFANEGRCEVEVFDIECAFCRRGRIYGWRAFEKYQS